MHHCLRGEWTPLPIIIKQMLFAQGHTELCILVFLAIDFIKV